MLALALEVLVGLSIQDVSSCNWAGANPVEKKPQDTPLLGGGWKIMSHDVEPISQKNVVRWIHFKMLIENSPGGSADNLPFHKVWLGSTLVVMWHAPHGWNVQGVGAPAQGLHQFFKPFCLAFLMTFPLWWNGSSYNKNTKKRDYSHL